MAGTKINPDNVWGPNEYAGNVAPKRGDAPFPREAGALAVDRANFESVMGTKSVLDKNATQANPLGQSH